MNTENLLTLKINKLTQEQYDREKEAGNIDPNALYLTPTDTDLKIDGKFDKITLTTIFDEDFNILKTTDTNKLGTDFATDCVETARYAFVASNVTEINATFGNCTNLTDIFIDNTEGEVLCCTAANIFNNIKTPPFPNNANVVYAKGCNTLQGLLLQINKTTVKSKTSGSITTDDTSISYDFTNATAELITHFHGHLHNFRIEKLGENEITTITIPNACFGRNNEYGTSSGYDETIHTNFGDVDENGNQRQYNKTANTAKDTAFNVIVVDRQNRKIHCFNYGAGIDREISY